VKTIEERFWAKVEKRPDGCWEWTGGTTGSTGYGQFWVKHRHQLAHRFSYTVIHGLEIPPGLTIDHLCRNRLCVNPAHLEPVTNRVNVLRGNGPAARNAKKTHCKRGHEFTPENTYRQRRKRGVVARLRRTCRTCRRRLEHEYRRRVRLSARPKS